jgi:hypothetical protein
MGSRSCLKTGIRPRFSKGLPGVLKRVLKERRNSTVTTSREGPSARNGGSSFSVSLVAGRTGVSAQAEAQLLRGFGWFLVVTLLACSVDRPAEPPVLPRQVSADPDALLAAVRERESRIRTLRARFTARTSSEGEKRTSDGVLLVKKPNGFRLRLTMPLGLTVFDYVSWGEHSQVSLPLEDRIVSGPAADHFGPLSRQDLGQSFLRGPKVFPGACVGHDGNYQPGILFMCHDASGTLLRQILIDERTAAIIEETSYDHGEPRMVLRFDDYRPVEGVYLPHRIALWYPRRLMSAEIAIQRYDVNPDLTDALFEPVVPWAGW